MSAAGRLDARVTIQRRVQSQDDFGEVLNGWEDVATVWAQVTALRGEELFAAQQVQSKVDHRIRVRHSPGIRPTMRIAQDFELDGTPVIRYFDIQAIIPEQSRKNFISLMCVLRSELGFRTAETAAIVSENTLQTEGGDTLTTEGGETLILET